MTRLRPGLEGWTDEGPDSAFTLSSAGIRHRVRVLARGPGSLLLLVEAPPGVPVPARPERHRLMKRLRARRPDAHWVVFTDAAHLGLVCSWSSQPLPGLELRRERMLDAERPLEALQRCIESERASGGAPGRLHGERDRAVEEAVIEALRRRLPRGLRALLTDPAAGRRAGAHGAEDVLQATLEALSAAREPGLARAVARVLLGEPGFAALDPACSGSWLPSVFRTLAVLCDACLDAARGWLADLDLSRSGRPERLGDLRAHLERAGGPDAERNRGFVASHLLTVSLHGAHPDAAAVQRCRAALLAIAGAERDPWLRELPLDLHVGELRHGLAGIDDLVRAASACGVAGLLPSIVAEAAAITRVRHLVRSATWAQSGPGERARAEAAVERRAERLRRRLHELKARESGLDAAREEVLARWVEARRPVHGFLELHRVLHGPGFDLVRVEAEA